MHLQAISPFWFLSFKLWDEASLHNSKVLSFYNNTIIKLSLMFVFCLTDLRKYSGLAENHRSKSLPAAQSVVVKHWMDSNHRHKPRTIHTDVILHGPPADSCGKRHFILYARSPMLTVPRPAYPGCPAKMPLDERPLSSSLWCQIHTTLFNGHYSNKPGWADCPLIFFAHLFQTRATCILLGHSKTSRS